MCLANSLNKHTGPVTMAYSTYYTAHSIECIPEWTELVVVTVICGVVVGFTL